MPKSPEQMGFEKSRAESDTELIRDGAELVVDEEGETHLEATEKQKENIAETRKKEVSYKELGYIPEIKENNENQIEKLRKVIEEMKEKTDEFTNNYFNKDLDKEGKNQLKKTISKFEKSRSYVEEIASFLGDNIDELTQRSISFVVDSYLNRFNTENIRGFTDGYFHGRNGGVKFYVSGPDYMPNAEIVFPDNAHHHSRNVNEHSNSQDFIEELKQRLEKIEIPVSFEDVNAVEIYTGPKGTIDYKF